MGHFEWRLQKTRTGPRRRHQSVHGSRASHRRRFRERSKESLTGLCTCTVRAEFASLPSTDRVAARKVRLQGWAKPDEQGARVDPPAALLGASRAAGSRRYPPVVWQHMCGDAPQVPRAGRRSGAQGGRPRAANGLLAQRAPHRASSARPAPRLGQGALWDLQALLLLGRVCGLRGNGAPVPHLRAPRPARGEGRRPIAVFDE